MSQDVIHCPGMFVGFVDWGDVLFCLETGSYSV